MDTQSKCRICKCICRCTQRWVNCKTKEATEDIVLTTPQTLAGAHLYIDSGNTINIAPQTPILFANAWLENNQNITYDNTGTFTISVAGTYQVHYQANLLVAQVGSQELSLNVNGSPVVKATSATIQSGIAGAVNGFALLALNAGDTLQVVNTNANEITLAETSPQAQIMILSLV